MSFNVLQKSLEYLKGVGPERFKLLCSELSLQSYNDLLHYFPFRYVDKSQIYNINQINVSQAEIQLKGKIISLQEIEQKKGKRLVAEFQDSTGSIELVWFKFSKWLKESIKLNKEVIIFGKISSFNNKFSMIHPEMDFGLEEKKINHTLFPVYSSTEKLTAKNITQKSFQKLFYELLIQVKEIIPENLSENILKQYQLISRKEAFVNIHFPENYAKLQAAEKRLKFEEMFFFQLSFGLKKINHSRKYKGFPMLNVGESFNTFYNDFLSFQLTDAQKRVIKEIRNDMRKSMQMNRLLQGDVGSGKTIVALLIMLLAKDNNFQSCLLAPTEILAIQHYNSIIEALQTMNVKVALLTGSTTSSQRKIIFEELENGTIDILIGTHAVLEDKVQFKNLGFAVIDEQHRFGVAQRAKLWHKNNIPPHILVMTATPIPRTLAMSYYSDLEVSTIDEMPKGRKPIQTFHKKDANRLEVQKFMRNEIEKGRQIYVVFPLIQESEKFDYKDLVEGYEALCRDFPLPKYAISVVHGKLSSQDKDFEMQRFIKGETQIMVATTVIEVGVNIPNASVMIVESAERFGLSQLHQLRGRVGRGNEQSYCILMTKDHISDDSYKRIRTMCETNDGFIIAETDLEMRGPGDILGTMQSGITDFKLISLSKDKQMIALTKNAVDVLLSQDENISKIENQRIKEFFIAYHRDKVSWSRIS